MATVEGYVPLEKLDEREYRRRIRAWTLYDWANSAFATTILAAVLPVYYSQVAGATLPSETMATAYWSLGLSFSLFVSALMAPILGTISDVMRGKKKFLTLFAGMGIVATGLMVLVSTGDWLLASILFIVGRIGFTAANVFYDALLPHVAREEDRDLVSTRGYALGYLGGGLLLALNIVMIQLLPGTWGPRLSFLSVALWWAIFSIPIFTQVPEPPAAPVELEGNVIAISFKRLAKTLRDIQQYKELFKFLIAFLIYNDGIGTIIGVAAIYGAELGFGTLELILALLLVQFVGIPFSLIFGRLPNKAEKRRPLFLAFILFNLIALPLGGIIGSRVLPGEITGAPLPPYEDTATAVGEGTYGVDSEAIRYTGEWEMETIPAEELRTDTDVTYAITAEPGAQYEIAFNGQRVKITYSTGPDRGIWAVYLDGEPYIDEDTGEPFQIDGYRATVRYGVNQAFTADEPGEHTLTVVNTGERNPASSGTLMTLAQISVEPPLRQSNLGIILGLILAVEIVGIVFALLTGKALFSGLAEKMDTKRSIILALSVYAVIAIWGYFLNSTIEFWFLAWMVAIVQGGSQALSRSLYASMSPASKSGEFFGLFGVMEKFSAVMGPALFAAAGAFFGSSRPAVLSLIVFFFIGIFLLTRVDVEEGRRVARMEDAELLGAAATD
ncbi:MAG TPA: MFS transporter [Chloroflexi bacterium]|nr:MFS transporter [Chloroflexota bacterium]